MVDRKPITWTGPPFGSPHGGYNRSCVDILGVSEAASFFLPIESEQVGEMYQNSGRRRCG
jgi:hypothetical protein